MDLPEAVRLLALHPFRELPTSPDVELIETGGVLLGISPFPNAQIIEPLDITPAAVAATVAATRAIARERGKTILAWWIAPEHDGLADALEAAGLVNEDTPGFRVGRERDDTARTAGRRRRRWGGGEGDGEPTRSSSPHCRC